MNGIDARKAELLEAHRIRWELGFNDPSWLGWLTVTGYIVAAVLAWRAARRGGIRFERRFWLAVCAGMAFLAVNKQLDLHILVTDLGRYWAVQNDLYPHRRAIQKAFMAAMVVAGTGGVLGFWLATRRSDPSLRLALAGLVLCGGYVLIRAASFHHLDVAMRTTVFGVRWAGTIELAGIALMALAAWRCRPRG